MQHEKHDWPLGGQCTCRCTCGKSSSVKIIPGNTTEMKIAEGPLIFRVTEQLNNVKIITEQKLGDGRKVYIPQEAKYQIRNESNYLLNLNFAKKDRF